MQEWFDLMDGIMDVHRANFVFREATPPEVEKHKTTLEMAIQTCHRIKGQIADRDFADLLSRLHIRIQQLQDAYNAFPNSKLSEEEAERILHQVFPE